MIEMTQKEINEMCRKMRRETRRIVKKGKMACRWALYKSGVYTTTGKLRKSYRQP
jgi:hypothetical protein